MANGGLVRFLFAAVIVAAAAVPAAAQFYESTPENATASDVKEMNVAVAWGNGFGAVWFRGDDIRYTRFDENNDQYDDPITIYTSPTGFVGDDLEVLYYNNLFYASFVRSTSPNSHVFVKRVHYNYDPFGPAKQLTSGNYYYGEPELAHNGTEFGFAYTRTAGADEVKYIFFQRLDNSLEPIGDPLRVFATKKDIDDLNLVWSGRYWGLAWIYNDKKIMIQRMRTNGTKKGARRIPFKSTNAHGVGWLRMVRRDAGAYACVFTWATPAASAQQIWFMRLRKTGKRFGLARQVSTTTGTAYEPTLTFDSLLKHYGVFWSDTRDNSNSPLIAANIYGAQLRSNGTILVGDTAITMGSGQDRWPVAVNNGDVGQLMWTRFELPNMDIWSTRMIVEAW